MSSAEVSMTNGYDRNSKKKKAKMAAISKQYFRTTKKVMSIYKRHMCIYMLKMKFLCLSIWTEEHTKENYQNGCHLKTTSQNH